MNKYYNFKFTSNKFLILKETSETTPEETETTRTVVDASHYENYIQSIPFFNNFGYKAYCKAKYNYTPAGRLPDTITTGSPDGLTKIVTRFKFISIDPMKKSAGARELDILKRAKTWAPFEASGRDIVELFTEPDADGHKASAAYDIFNYIWVN